MYNTNINIENVENTISTKKIENNLVPNCISRRAQCKSNILIGYKLEIGMEPITNGNI